MFVSHDMGSACDRLPRYRALLRVAMPALWLLACSGEPAAPRVRTRAAAIIGGTPAIDLTGVAQVSHAQGDRVCSGVLIAPELVLTAKHCVFRSTSTDDQALPANGFRLGFGPDDASFVVRGAARVTWIDAPDALSVEQAVAAGEDVAVLQLLEPAPAGEQVREIALDFEPAADQPVRLAGYGLVDQQSGVSGGRNAGTGRVTGYEPETGVIQVSGDSSCFGDSGGPVLNAAADRVLGVLGQVGGSSASEFCDLGLSFAATAANARVRRFLARECAGVGGCPHAGGEVAADDAGEEPERARDAGATIDADIAAPDAAGAPDDAPGADAGRAGPQGAPDAGDAQAADSGCAVTHSPGGARGFSRFAIALAALALLLLLRRHGGKHACSRVGRGQLSRDPRRW